MGRLLRPSPASLAYVAAVGVLAGLGFTSGSTVLILVAAALALPASLAAVPAYYVAYGVLAALLAGSPDRSTGGGSVAGDGHVTASLGTGDPAGWFIVGMEVLGITTLLLAAAANVVLVRLLAARRTASPGGAAAH